MKSSTNILEHNEQSNVIFSSCRARYLICGHFLLQKSGSPQQHLLIHSCNATAAKLSKFYLTWRHRFINNESALRSQCRGCLYHRQHGRTTTLLRDCQRKTQSSKAAIEGTFTSIPLTAPEGIWWWIGKCQLCLTECRIKPSPELLHLYRRACDCRIQRLL